MTSPEIGIGAPPLKLAGCSVYSGFSPRVTRLVGVCLGVVLLINATTLGVVPAGITDDDGAYASAAHTFWKTGKPGVPGYHDIVDMNKDVWAFGRLAAAAQGFVMAMLGVSVWNAMAPTFLAGLVLVICTGGFARAIAGTDSALLAMLALAMSGKFFLSTHGMRPDTLFASFMMASLWIIASRSSTQPVPALFTAGLVTGISSDVHINGFFLCPVPALFWLASSARDPIAKVRGLAANVGGLSVGFAMWGLLHYVPNPDRFHSQLPIMGGATHGFRLLALGLVGAALGECQRYLDWFWYARGFRHVPEMLCVVVGAIWVAARASRPLRATFVAWCGIFFLSAVFLSNPFGWYLIYVWPLFCIWMASAFVACHRKFTARLLLVALLAVSLSDIALWSYKAMKDVPYSTQVANLRKAVPPGVPVLASGCWWFAFWDRDFTDIAYVDFRGLEASLTPNSRVSVWEHEQHRRGWKYIVASNRLLAILDPDVTDLAAATGPRLAIASVVAARRFVHEHSAKWTRLPGIDNQALIFELAETPHP